MKHALATVVASMTVTAAATTALADPALPAAMRAKLEAIAPLQQPTIYVPAAGKAPQRWLAFIGPSSAASAYLVTPGAGANELDSITGWPTSVRVVGAAIAPVQGAMPGNAGEPQAWVIVESLDAPVLGQPAGLRGVLQISLPADPKSAFSVSSYAENLAAFMGVKDPSEIPARLATASAYWQEDTADKLIADDARRTKLVATAIKSKAALGKLFPAGGISVLDLWQGVFARERTHLHALDATPASADLRAAVGSSAMCMGHACGSLLLGVDGGRPVIRAFTVAQSRAAAPRGARHAVAANANDTQTMATARLFGATGTFRGEAPLGIGTGTIGLFDSEVVMRDGAFTAMADSYAEPVGSPPRFADLDGDGLTDLIVRGQQGHVVFGGPPHGTGDLEAGYELSIAERATVDDMLAAALAVPDGAVTPKAACAVLAGTKTAAGVARALAPNGNIYSFQEPFHPGWGELQAFPVADRATELHRDKGCSLTCDDKLPFCARHDDMGPGADFYVFARVNGKLRLYRAALYRGG